MVQVSLDGDRVVFEVLGFHKLLALKSRLKIPRANIRGAGRDPGATRGWRGWRLPGTYIPGLITAGTFYLRGRRIFWDVCDRGNVVVVDLDGERYDRLIIEVQNPDAVVGMLTEGY